jgi:hypothetical protein
MSSPIAETPLDRPSLEGSQPTTRRDIMSNNQTTRPDARLQDSKRDDVLNAIHSKWGKFSKQELDALKTNDELVTQVAAKYGIEQDAARRDVDALMDGRSLAA